MKKKIRNEKKLLSIALFLVTVGLMVFGYYETAGACLAFAAPVTVAGTVTVDSESSVTELLSEEIEKIIVEETRALSPVNCIIKQMRSGSKTGVLNPKYFSIAEKALSTSVTTKYTPAATPLSVITIDVADSSMFTKRETIAIVGVKSYNGKEGTEESTVRRLMAIVVKREEGQLKIQVVNGKIGASKKPTFADEIPAGAKIVRMGKAESEKAMKTDSTAQMPELDENYCQNFMLQVEESEWSQIHTKNANHGFSEFLKMALNDFATTKELSFLFGVKSETKDPDTGETLRTCDGIIQKIDKVFNYGSTGMTEKIMADIMQMLFDGNNGNSTRFAFLGSDLYLKFQQIPAFQKQIDGSKDPNVIFGLEFDRIKYGGNTLMLMKHPLFAYAEFSDCGICLDMDHIGERVFKPFTKNNLDLKTSGEMNADVMSASEVVCPVVKNRDTHMLLMP